MLARVGQLVRSRGDSAGGPTGCCVGARVGFCTVSGDRCEEKWRLGDLPKGLAPLSRPHSSAAADPSARQPRDVYLQHYAAMALHQIREALEQYEAAAAAAGPEALRSRGLALAAADCMLQRDCLAREMRLAAQRQRARAAGGALADSHSGADSDSGG